MTGAGTSGGNTGGVTGAGTNGGNTGGATNTVMKFYEGMAFVENNANSTTTNITSGKFQVQVSSAGSGALHFTFTPEGWSTNAVTLRYAALVGARHEVQMNGGGGNWQYTARNLGQNVPVAYWFSFQQEGGQYITDSCAAWTSS